MLQKRREQGSIVLEASIVLPFFIFVVLFLIYIVQMTLVSTALQTVASETVKQVSSQIYPVSRGVDSISSAADHAVSKMPIPKLSLDEWSGRFAGMLPAPLSEWMEQAVQAGKSPLEELKGQVAETVLDPVIKPLFKSYVEKSLLRYERIHVTGITVPDLASKTNPYFKVELRYELPMKVPFLYRSIYIQAAAEERLWIGDTGEGSSDGKNTGGNGSTVIELLYKPEPAIKGKYNKIKVRIPPGSSANLSVLYKSGSSTAKHIGWAAADAEGILEWNWFVGTKTTPGQWAFIVETADGSRIEVPFEVAESSSS
ncbi:pilus assembly protein [Paenibacillus sp. JX-17]|uniref:Pilus assembly protein n=1 Tax=Paenibacillus lacisoli TaxID=3064525 RepID=A0ABT9CF83_9BACL|nr:pilus assembly protein [Paenibacillus sp. JX-17]MDO7907299.1 pilus assembly protein [Paenibacillus sp. JX-17]